MYEIGSDVWPGMAKVIEEAGELLQVMAKIMSCQGDHEYWDGTDLRIGLMEECADLEAALHFFLQLNWDRMSVDREVMGPYYARYKYKVDKFMEWHGKQQTQRTKNEAYWEEMRQKFMRETGSDSGTIIVEMKNGKGETIGLAEVDEAAEFNGVIGRTAGVEGG